MFRELTMHLHFFRCKLPSTYISKHLWNANFLAIINPPKALWTKLSGQGLRNFTGSPTVLIFFDCVLNKIISLLFQFQRVIRLLENVDTEMQVTRTVTMRWKCSMTYIPCFSYRTKYKKSTSCRRKRKSGLDLRWVHQFLFAHLVKLRAVLFTLVRRARSDRKNSRAKTGDETLVSRVSRPQCLRGFCFCRFFLAFSLSLI